MRTNAYQHNQSHQTIGNGYIYLLKVIFRRKREFHLLSCSQMPAVGLGQNQAPGTLPRALTGVEGMSYMFRKLNWKCSYIWKADIPAVAYPTVLQYLLHISLFLRETKVFPFAFVLWSHFVSPPEVNTVVNLKIISMNVFILFLHSI